MSVLNTHKRKVGMHPINELHPDWIHLLWKRETKIDR